MRICLTVLLATLGSAVVSVEAQTCEVEGKQVVEHARKKGFRFETTRASVDGTCETDSSESIFFASATSRSEVLCDVRILSRRAPADAVAPAASPATAEATSASSAWVITSIRIAGPSASSIYAERHASEDGSWIFQIRSEMGQTVQYRIDKIEFTTDKDCKQWKDAF